MRIERQRYRQNYGTERRSETRAAGVETLNPLYHTGKFSQNGVMEYPRLPISEMHLGKFPEPLEFQSWKFNFKTEKSAESAFLHITMQWIKEVEIVKSTDDLVTSQSIEGQEVSDFEMLDAKIASALKKVISSPHFRRSKCRRAASSKNTTDINEEGRLRMWSMTTFEQPELMTQLKACQVDSTFTCTMMTCRISIQDGTKLCWQQVEYLRTMSSKVCTYEIQFSFRQCWLCMNKKLIETEQRQAI